MTLQTEQRKTWIERRNHVLDLIKQNPNLRKYEIAKLAGENAVFVCHARMSDYLLRDTRYSRVIELLIEDNLTLDKIAEQERVPRCNINLVLRGLLAEGRITKKQKLRQAQRLEVANIKKQVVEFLSQNPTATNDQVVKAVPGFKNTRHIKNTRSELAIHTGQRNEISIRYVVIKASRAAGVTLEELAKIFGITRERVRQIEASKSFNAIDFSLGDDAG